jgi:hypothetical protein
MTAPEAQVSSPSDSSSAAVELARRIVAMHSAVRPGVSASHGAGALAAVLRRALSAPARRLARHLVAYDRDLGATPADAARRLLASYDVRLHVERAGRERAPIAEGSPLVIVANHPGILDCFAIAAVARRGDLVSISKTPIFPDLLPHLDARLIASGPDMGSVLAYRRALTHMRGGGALLLFPAGQPEPDPRLAASSTELVKPWLPGFGALVRGAGLARADAMVLPVAVSGTVSPSALLLARRLPIRGPLATSGDPVGTLLPLLQLGAIPGFSRDRVVVHVGEPVRCADLGRDGTDLMHREVARLAERAHAHWHAAERAVVQSNDSPVISR